MFEQHVIRMYDNEYPESLLDLAHPPQVLYAIGNIDILKTQGLGIVGSRKATPYGLSCAELMGTIAGENGICLVSGGAKGCDFQAGMAAINAGGQSILVAGGGADVVYPYSSKPLFERLWAGEGVVISLVKWGTPPQRYLFPRRNPVIAALSKSLLVVEAANSSGTFSTALAAADLGRNLYAIPGSIFSPLSVGTNKLIQDGASIICDRESLEIQLSLDFDILHMTHEQGEISDPLIRNLLSSPMSLEEISQSLNKKPADALIMVSQYEAKGLVSRLITGQYSLTAKGYIYFG